MNEISAAMQALAGMRQIRGRQNETELDTWISRASFWLYLASASILAVLGYVALLMMLVDTPRIVGSAGVFAALGAISLAIVGFILSTTSLFLSVFNSLIQDAAIRAQEHDYDLTNVAELIQFNEQTLSCV